MPTLDPKHRIRERAMRQAGRKALLLLECIAVEDEKWRKPVLAVLGMIPPRMRHTS